MSDGSDPLDRLRRGQPTGTIDVDRLLTIDVAAELRKLTQAQLQGPWQVPAEFVRRSLRDGAKNVDVELRWHQARITDDGRGFAPEHLGWTATLLDHHRGNEERHAALTLLESAGELALLTMAGLDVRELAIVSTARGRRASLVYRPGRATDLSLVATDEPDGSTVLLRCPALERRQCSEWLHDVAKFAPGSVAVDGKPILSGFVRVLAQAELAAPLSGRVAIPTEGETAHAWLLEHGIVTAHVAIPDAPCFEAAVELGKPGTELDAARLRAAIQPHVVALIDQAVGVLVRAGGGPAGQPESARARFARLLLHAARKRLRVSDVTKVPAFRVVAVDGERLIDLVQLRAAGTREASGLRILLALYPGQDPDRYALSRVPVVVADEAERSMLAEVMHVRFRPPDLRQTEGRLAAGWRRLADSLARAAGRAAELARHPLRSPPLDDAALHPSEWALLEVLRTQLAADPSRDIEGVQMCEGSGPIRRSRGPGPRLLLPRRNPAVVACVAALAHDPDWAYPAFLALLEGHGSPSPELRARYVNREDA